MITEPTPAPSLDAAAVHALRARLRGTLIQPDDHGYEAARAVYNGMIDRRPALIAHCADVADVISCVNFAREHQVTLAIRSGGHNGAGLGTCDDGLVIDLSPMKGIRVDPTIRTVRVEGGCTWGDIDHATHAFGLATPSGFISTTGVGGLTLGGGIGYLTRAHGLTLDNLLAVDMVLADGSFITGPCAAAAATSAWWSRSCSAPIPSAPSMAGPCSGRWTWLRICCNFGASSS
jgi:FAD/FMN-containing dehydrogenase